VEDAGLRIINKGAIVWENSRLSYFPYQSVLSSLERAERKGSEVAVLFLDLDNFKTINDTLGHASGDALLFADADRLQVSLRTSDTASRLGGDEFAVLIEDTTDTEGGVLVAERIREVLRHCGQLKGKGTPGRAAEERRRRYVHGKERRQEPICRIRERHARRSHPNGRKMAARVSSG